MTTSLSFDVPTVVGQEAANAQKKSYRAFVNNVLSFHKVSPIKKFNLNCGRHTYGKTQLNAWISDALSKSVEQLHLHLGNRPVNALPDCLFTSQTLVELKINSRIEELQVPESIHLPNLKILNLSTNGFVDSDSFSRFFAACPMLHVLEVGYLIFSNDTDHHVRVSFGELERLKMCVSQGSFEIDSPKLAYLHVHFFGSAIIVLSLKNPERLVAAHLEIGTFNNHELQHALALIKAVQYVEELHLQLDMSRASSEDHLPSYPNLVNLSLGGLSYDAWKYATHLLGNSPRLETVVVIHQGLNKGMKRGDKWPTNVALVLFSSSVKVIDVFHFLGYTTELFLLKYLLGNL